MQTAPYSEEQIYPLSLSVGRAFAVVLKAGETATDSWGSDSTDILVELSNNLVLFKPVRQIPAQAIYVKSQTADGKTRLYSFEASVAPPDPNDSRPYTLTFKYPSEEATERVAKAKTRSEKAQAELVAAQLRSTPIEDTNFRYTLQGKTQQDFNLLPGMHVADDNTSTHFTFPGNMRLPIIYIVTPDNKEATADYTFDSSTGVATVHQLAEWFRLRDGDNLLTVHNVAYDPVGTRPSSGTSNPNIIRVLRAQP